MSSIGFDDQLALFRNDLYQAVKGAVKGPINGFVDDLCRNQNILKDTITRKDKIIARLQRSYKQIYAANRLLKEELDDCKLSRGTLEVEEVIKLKEKIEMLKDENRLLKEELDKCKLSRGKLSRDNLKVEEVIKLKEKIEMLKDENKAKSRKLKKYKLALDNAVAEKYADDPDEEDGTPSEEEEADIEDFEEDAETDVEMGTLAHRKIDGASLLNEDEEEDSGEGNDTEDSEFEIEKADKDEAENDKEESEEFIGCKSADKHVDTDGDIDLNDAEEDEDITGNESSEGEAIGKKVVEAETAESKEEEREINFTQTE